MNLYNLIFITVAVFLAVSFGATTPAPTTASPTTALPTTSSVGKVCKYNYQCSGNTICDGTACTGGLGLVLDSSSNTLAYGSTCEYSTGSRYTLRTVSASGGVPNVFSVVFANDNVRRVVAYRDGDIYFDELRPDGTHALFRAGQTLLGFTVVTQEPTIPYNFQGFEEIAPSGVIYQCVSDNSGNFLIVQYPTALNLESIPVPIVVYSLGANRCGPVRVGVNNGLLYVSYFVGTQTLIFQGSTGCVNCAIPTRPFLSIAAVVNDFDVSTNYLFYGTAAGLFRSNITSTSAPVKITPDNVLGVSAGASPLVYFTNSLGGVFSTPVDVNPSYPSSTNVAQKGSSTCQVESS